MESVAPNGVSAGKSGKLKKCCDGVERGGPGYIVPYGKAGKGYRYRFVKPPPEGLHLTDSERALLAIIECGEQQGGFTRAELRKAALCLIPSLMPVTRVIALHQKALFRNGLIRVDAPPENSSNIPVDSPLTIT